MNPEIIDNINKPSHYQGRYWMESIDALRNFMTPEQLKGFFMGNSLKYILRHQKKNGLEDLKKARKNLEWLIEEFEVEKWDLKNILTQDLNGKKWLQKFTVGGVQIILK